MLSDNPDKINQSLISSDIKDCDLTEIKSAIESNDIRKLCSSIDRLEQMGIGFEKISYFKLGISTNFVMGIYRQYKKQQIENFSNKATNLSKAIDFAEFYDQEFEDTECWEPLESKSYSPPEFYDQEFEDTECWEPLESKSYSSFTSFFPALDEYPQGKTQDFMKKLLDESSQNNLSKRIDQEQFIYEKQFNDETSLKISCLNNNQLDEDEISLPKIPLMEFETSESKKLTLRKDLAKPIKQLSSPIIYSAELGYYNKYTTR